MGEAELGTAVTAHEEAPVEGVHEGVSMPTYLGWPLPSSSTVKMVGHRTMLAIKKDLDGGLWEDSDTGVQFLGTVVHSAVLEPDDFEARYLRLPTPDPDKYLTSKGEPSKNPKSTSAYKADVADLHAANPKLDMVSAADYEKGVAMRDRVFAHEAASAVLKSEGVAEASVIVTDSEYGLRCKLRPDFHSSQLAWNVNLKTTKNAQHDKFARDYFTLGYYISESFYARMLPQAGLPVRQCIILAIENSGAHEVILYEPDEAFMDMGAQVVSLYMRRVAECMDKDEWPGLAGGLVQLSPADWMFSRVDEII